MLQKTDLYYQQYLPEIKDINAFDKYLKLIDIALNRKNLDGYVERHHIVPRCYLPKEWKYKDTLVNNIVIFTAKEHFLAHKYLKESIYDLKMLYAFQRICTLIRDNRTKEITAFEYELVKKQYNKYRKENFVVSDEHRKKISESLKGKSKPKFSEEHKRKLSMAHKGKIPYNKGKHISKEQILKQKESMKNRVWINNSIINKLIKYENLNDYINIGWKCGRLRLNILNII